MIDTPRELVGNAQPPRRRPRFSRLLLQIACFAVAAGFVIVTAVDPYSGAVASTHFTVTIDPYKLPAQELTVAGGQFQNTAARDQYTSKEAPPPPPAPASVPSKSSSSSGGGGSAPSAAIPDAGTARAIGYQKVKDRGWSDSEWDCLDALFSRESGWRVNAYNPSGAYGIPQALPGSKMGSVADDWQTNPATQIEWGLGYITGRYGTPCGAWGHSESYNWY